MSRANLDTEPEQEYRREQLRRSALDAYRAALAPGELYPFCISALDKTGMPVWVVIPIANSC